MENDVLNEYKFKFRKNRNIDIFKIKIKKFMWRIKWLIERDVGIVINLYVFNGRVGFFVNNICNL